MNGDNVGKKWSNKGKKTNYLDIITILRSKFPDEASFLIWCMVNIPPGFGAMVINGQTIIDRSYIIRERLKQAKKGTRFV